LPANLIALHPSWTPDQVKGALMLTAAQPGAAPSFALGVGEVDAAAALALTDSAESERGCRAVSSSRIPTAPRRS